MVVNIKSRTFAATNNNKLNIYSVMEKEVKNWKGLLKVINAELKNSGALIGVTTDGEDLYHILMSYKDKDGLEVNCFYCDNAEEHELGDMLNEALANIRMRIRSAKIAKESEEEKRKREPHEMLVTFTITAKVLTKNYDNVSEAIAEMDFSPRGGNVSDWHYEDPYMMEYEEA